MCEFCDALEKKGIDPRVIAQTIVDHAVSMIASVVKPGTKVVVLMGEVNAPTCIGVVTNCKFDSDVQNIINRYSPIENSIRHHKPVFRENLNGH